MVSINASNTWKYVTFLGIAHQRIVRDGTNLNGGFLYDGNGD